ncbi:unnamed protein product [Alopecurus aequalis]
MAVSVEGGNKGGWYLLGCSYHLSLSLRQIAENKQVEQQKKVQPSASLITLSVWYEPLFTPVKLKFLPLFRRERHNHLTRRESWISRYITKKVDTAPGDHY